MKEIFIRNKNIVSMTRLFNAAVIYPILGIDLGSQTTGVAVKFESSPTFPVGEITLNRKDNRADLNVFYLPFLINFEGAGSRPVADRRLRLTFAKRGKDAPTSEKPPIDMC